MMERRALEGLGEGANQREFVGRGYLRKKECEKLRNDTVTE